MDEIERLPALGKKDLEAGYPQYARQYFEKVLALDATNREAIEGLVQVDELLSRRTLVPVKPIQAEPMNSLRSLLRSIKTSSGIIRSKLRGMYPMKGVKPPRMNRNPWRLSKKALKIATECPKLWEYRLFAQIIIDEVDAHKNLLRQDWFTHGSRPDPVPFPALGLWAREKFEELHQIAKQLVALIELNHDDAFGPPGKPGDVTAIVTLSRKIGSFYRRIIEWMQTVQATPIDPQYANITRELVSFATGTTMGIERFGPDLLQQIENALGAPPDGRPSEINATLNVAPANPDRLIKAINRLSYGVGCGAAGYLYLLVNPSMEGLVKIGKTTRNPRERAKELGVATGVPTPFILVFDVYVDDCHRAEEYVHTRLGKNRVSSKREFFQVPTNDAIKVLLEAQRFVSMDRSKV